MRPPAIATGCATGASQRGMSTLELLLTGFLGCYILATGGYLFRNLVREFRDIRDQARIQADMKSALQAMTRQIGNLGALLPDPLEGFSPHQNRLQFAYVDVPGRFCNPNAKVSVAYYAERLPKEDLLIQSLACPDGMSWTRRLASAPPGALQLSFRYLDGSGNPTASPASIKAVELSLALETGPALAGRRFEKTRGQVTRIQCMSL